MKKPTPARAFCLKNVWRPACLFAVLFLSTALFSQKADSTGGPVFFEKKEVERIFSLNMTPLMTQLVPFNRSNPLVTGPYNVRFKKYKNGSGLRMGLGANFRVLTDDDADQVFNMHIGWERRKRVSGRVAMTAGVDGFLSFGGFNLQGGRPAGNDDFFDDFEGGIGVGPVWGLEYALTKDISISTETALHIPIASTLGIFLLPPTGVFINYRFDGGRRTTDGAR